MPSASIWDLVLGVSAYNSIVWALTDKAGQPKITVLVLKTEY